MLLLPVCLVTLIFLSFLAFIATQQTGVLCSSVNPISVPRDPSLYWGTWYTIATCNNCTNPANVCTQLTYEPIDSTQIDTNLTYIGSYQDSNPSGDVAQAFGKMSPINLETFNPIYRLTLDLGFAIIPANFWILTTAGDGAEITAIVTMSCVTSGTDQQIFFLSRKPYFVSPVTFESLESNVRRAINNYDEFDIVSVTQAQGWCNYQLPEVSINSVSSDHSDCDVNDQQITIAAVFSIISSAIALITLAFLAYLKYSSSTTKKADSVMNSSLM